MFCHLLNAHNSVYGVYLPIVMSVIMGFFAFVLPINCGERFGVGMTSLLTVFAIMFISKEGDPAVGAISLQNVFYFGSIWYSILPIIGTAIVYKLSVSNENDVHFWEQQLAELFWLLRIAQAKRGATSPSTPSASPHVSSRRDDSTMLRNSSVNSNHRELTSQESFKRVWVMGRRKRVAVTRTETQKFDIKLEIGNYHTHKTYDIDKLNKMPSFKESFWFNLVALMRLTEARFSRFVTVTLSCTCCLGYFFFLLFFYIDAEHNGGNSHFVKWLSNDLSRYYGYLIMSSVMAFIIIGFIWIMIYTYRQRCQMVSYGKL